MKHPNFDDLHVGQIVWYGPSKEPSRQAGAQWAVANLHPMGKRVTIINMKTRKVRTALPLSNIWVPS